jgi:lysophospholipase L1-like esterase
MRKNLHSNIVKSIIGIALLAFLSSCNSDPLGTTEPPVDTNNPIEYSPGSADFSNYVAIGNSLTAGFVDGALYNLGQQKSIPALLAGQLRAAGGQAVFNQPSVNSDYGCSNPGSGCTLGKYKLDADIPGPSPTLLGDPITAYAGDKTALHNFGVPGIQVGQLLTPETGIPGATAFNPYYARFASSPGTSTILGDVLSRNPSFFTLWIGNNDVLGYATSGATNEAIFTDPAAFRARFEIVVGQLMGQTDAEGIVVDIPPILYAPYFQAVPYNAVVFDPESDADMGIVSQLNANFSGFNAALAGLQGIGQLTAADVEERKIQYTAGANPVLIQDLNLEDLSSKFDVLATFGAMTAEQRAALQPYVQARPIKQGEIITLPAGGVIGTLADPNNPTSVLGVALPLPAQFALAAADIQRIEQRRGELNAIIADVAGDYSSRIAFYNTNDPNGTFADLFGIDGSAPGIEFGGQFLNADFSPFGLFSTDGIHPNPRGAAIVANEMLDLIESSFSATLPRVNVLSLPTVALCTGQGASSDCASRVAGL